MKSFLQNVLIVLALGLCLLCAVQWLREARLQQELALAQATIAARDKTVLELQTAGKRLEADLLSLDSRNAGLRDALRTNAQELAELRQNLSRAEGDLGIARAQLGSYKQAITQANANIETNNAAIRDQNKLLQETVAQRDDLLKRLNEMTRRYNDLVEKYNALVKQVEAVRAGQPGS